MLVPQNLEDDEKRFQKIFSQHDCQNIKSILDKVLEEELKGLANNTVLRKNFESQDRHSCESILAYSCVKLKNHLDTLKKDADKKTVQKDPAQSGLARFKISKLSEKIEKIKLSFKKTEVSIQPIQHKTFDPEDPIIVAKDTKIADLEASIQDRQKQFEALKTKTMQLQREALIQVQEKVNQVGFEEFMDRMRYEFESVTGGKRMGEDPTQKEITELVRQKNQPVSIIQTKGMFGSLLSSTQKNDSELLSKKPYLDEIFTLYNFKK